MDKPADHPAIPAPRIGVLLVNLGTPDEPEATAGISTTRGSDRNCAR